MEYGLYDTQRGRRMADPNRYKKADRSAQKETW